MNCSAVIFDLFGTLVALLVQIQPPLTKRIGKNHQNISK